MKYLQVVGSVACVLLGIIAFELHGLQPVKSSQVAKIMEHGSDGQKKQILENLPITSVYAVWTDVDVSSLPALKADVNVENQVSVTTKYINASQQYENEPLKVEIDR